MDEIDKLLEYVTNNTDDIVERIDDPEMEAIMNVLSEMMEEGKVESIIEDGIVKYRLTNNTNVDQDDEEYGDKLIEELLAELDCTGDEDDDEDYYSDDED